jgi:glyoxylase-like metal-dependent hydrolase (beta-lactamase superfamily II)
VVDPGSPFPEEQARLDAVLDALAAEGRRVREVRVTHHHFDHVGGVEHLRARLPGVPIAAHRRTAELLAGRVRFDRHIDDGEVLALDAGTPGERRLRAVFTPGHTPGHLCYLEEVTGVLIAGDMLAGAGFIVIDPPEGDMRQYLDSLARLKALAPRAIYPAHGLVIADAAARLDEYVAHRLAREAKVAAALDAATVARRAGAGSGAAGAGATLAELLPVAYDDTPLLLHPIAARSLHAHLLKLQADARAREVAPGRWVGAP